MIEARFRPLGNDFGARTPEHRRKSNPFGSSWTATMELLKRELDALNAKNIVIQVGLQESQIRNDGWPRADARPADDAVILHFDSRHGHLRYATDLHRGGTKGYGSKRVHMPGWQVNLRAIALGLEALRKVQRYGIAESGQQYTGYKALAAPARTSDEDPEGVLLAWAFPEGTSVQFVELTPTSQREVVRQAKRRAHPDAGGSDEAFVAVSQAAATLGL